MISRILWFVVLLSFVLLAWKIFKGIVAGLLSLAMLAVIIYMVIGSRKT